jgi:hypothetical protein
MSGEGGYERDGEGTGIRDGTDITLILWWDDLTCGPNHQLINFSTFLFVPTRLPRECMPFAVA